MQLLFILRRNTRGVSGGKWRRWLSLPQHFRHFPVPASNIRVSRGSNKKSVAIKLFQFCNLKTQQRYNLQEEVNFFRRELICLVDCLRDILKGFDHPSKYIQILLLNSKVEIGSTKSKENLFAHCYNDINEHPNRQIRLSSRFANNNSCVFSIKKVEPAINLILQKSSTLTIAKFTISTRTDFTLQTNVK